MGGIFPGELLQTPIRAESTHEANQTALKALKPTFGTMKLIDIDALRNAIRIITETGITDRGTFAQSPRAAASRSSQGGRGGTRNHQTDNGASRVQGLAQGF
jgi:hypothetical protein